MSSEDGLYRHIVNAVPEGIWVVSPEGRTIFCNQRMAELLGTSVESLRLISCFDPLFPEDLEEAQRRFQLQIAGGGEPFDFRLRRMDGSPVWVSISCKPVYDDGGVCTGLLGLFTDLSQRRQAESDLQESEKRFRAIFSQAAVGIAQTGLDGRWLLLNDRFCELLGYSQAELHGRAFLDITHPDDRNTSLTALRQMLAGEVSAWSDEKRYIRKNGITVWARIFTSVVRDEHNQPQYFISVVEDITEQKLIDERLRASQVHLMDAQRLAKVGSWERDIATERLDWSEEMYRISGIDMPPPTLAAYLETVHPKDRERVSQASHQARSGASSQELSYRIIRPDGEVRFVRSIAQAVRDPRGTVTRLVGAIQDTTEQFMVEERLRTSEERLKNAERLAQLGHWQWDVHSNRVSGSEEMYRIFGKPPDYIPSYEGFLADLMPHDKARMQLLVQDSLTRRVGHSTEYQITHPNGDLRTISCIWEVQTDEEGLPVRIFGTCQDITDSRLAQEESFARQKLESVGMLASGIAHDFNNLLGGVLVQVEVAMAERDSETYPEEELKAIREVAIRGSEIVRQLMIYAGKESEVLELVDVSQIVKEMVELLKISVSKHATLYIELGQNLPCVLAGAAQLRQIVMNLVTNASEAIGDQGGVIRVTTQEAIVSESVAPAKGLVPGNYLQLEISDTGCGMPPETQARMFDPFFTTKTSGNGLGLAVVHGIVKSLRGTMDVASIVDKGTTLRVWLPCAETTVSGTTAAIPKTDTLAHLRQPATVLIIEDEEVLRKGAARLLHNSGFQVLEAATGSAAIDLLRGHRGKIDLMLLDATIPGASSYEVVAEAAQAPSGIKVILTSAYGQEMLTPLMGAPQICGFIRKPFQFRNLMDVICGALLTHTQSPAE